MNTTAEAWPTIRSAAVQYGMSEKTIRRRISEGTLEARRFGPRLIRINPASLERWGNSVQYMGGVSQ